MEEQQKFPELPSVEDIKKLIAEYETADLEKVSFNKLSVQLRRLKWIPILTAKLNKGYHIERARINKPNEIFYTEKDLSYRNDYENIKTYGRANVKHHSLFYGAIESDVIAHPRLISLLETSQIFRNLDKIKVDKADFVMTVGKWKIKEDLEVAEMVFNENSIKNSKDVEKSFNHHLKNLEKEHPENLEQFKLILEFFSNQFAKKEIEKDTDYMISAAFADFVMNWKGLPGLKYPSVKSDYMGHNIVLTPAAVEQYLELDIAAMFRVTKNGENSLISPIKHATDFGGLNSKFKWVDVDDKKIPIEK
jgi:hypothetical protein